MSNESPSRNDALPHVSARPPAALFLVAAGLVQLLAPYALVMLDIQTDLIGTRGGENVEPAPWRVRLTRLAGVGFTAAGVATFGGAGLVV